MTEIRTGTWDDAGRPVGADSDEDATTFPDWIANTHGRLGDTGGYVPPEARRRPGKAYFVPGRIRLLRRYYPVDTGSASAEGEVYVWFHHPSGVDPEWTDLGHFEQTVVRLASGSAYTRDPSENVSEAGEFRDTLSEDIEALLDRLFLGAKEEQFEPGMESGFAKGLDRLLRHDPYGIVRTLKARLSSGAQDPEVLAEMLHWAGRQESRLVRESIMDLLSTGLNQPSPLVRDAAALAIAHIGSAAAPKLLEMAIEKEHVPELRKDLEDLARSLES